MKVSKAGLAIRCTVAGFAVLLVLFSFFSFHYSDYSDTLDNSMLLGDALLDGNLGEYYEFAAKNASGTTVYTANYDVPLYAVFLVWNLPTFIAHRAGGFDYSSSAAALLWCKALILAGIAVSAVFFLKILSFRTDDRGERFDDIVIFVSSSCVVFPALVTCQYDVLPVALTLAGLYFYLKKRDVIFTVIFALAVPLKIFALFVYIPLLLLREKRIWAIFLRLIPAFAVNFIASLPFRGNDWYEMCLGSQNRDAADLIINSSIKIGGVSVCPFIAAFLAICVMSYISKACDEDEKTYHTAIYASAAAMASFVCLVAIRSYWCIVSVPFVLLVACSRAKHRRANMLLFIIGGAFGTVYYMSTHWVLSYGGLIKRFILSGLGPREGYELKYGGISSLIKAYSLDKYAPLALTLFIAATAMIFILNRPGVKTAEGGAEKPEARYPALQVGITALLVAATVFSCTAVRRTALVSGKVSGYSGDILDGSTVSCDFVSQEDRTVTEIGFTAKNGATARHIRSTVEVALVDSETGEVLFEKTVGTVLVPNEKEYTVKVGGVTLEEGHGYEIVFRGSALRNYGSTFRIGCGSDGKPAVTVR